MDQTHIPETEGILNGLLCRSVTKPNRQRLTYGQFSDDISRAFIVYQILSKMIAIPYLI